MKYRIKVLQKCYAKFLLAEVACFLLLVLPCAQGDAGPYPKPKVPNLHVKASKDTETRIRTVLMMSNKNVYDCDRNGKVDCIDHAVLFKVCWDERYSSRDCIIVRNYNESKRFHHLFCAVWDEKLVKFVSVETWLDDAEHGSWCMHCVWGDVYDAWYDHCDETEHWVRKGTRKRR